MFWNLFEIVLYFVLQTKLFSWPQWEPNTTSEHVYSVLAGHSSGWSPKIVTSSVFSTHDTYPWILPNNQRLWRLISFLWLSLFSNKRRSSSAAGLTSPSPCSRSRVRPALSRSRRTRASYTSCWESSTGQVCRPCRLPSASYCLGCGSCRAPCALLVAYPPMQHSLM